MKKRLLSGLLAVVLVLGLLPAAFAAAPAQEEAAQVLAALDIMVGDENGNLNLDRAVTRAEFTKMAVAASTSRDSVGDTVSVKPYPDVPSTHWAAPFVKAAVDLNLVQGDLRGYFNPNRTITLAEGVTIVLRLLGYSDGDFTGVWPSGQMAQYRALKLNEGITIGQNTNMTRRDAMYLFYNLMITRNTSGTYHLNVLEPALNLVSQSGEIDRVALINSAMEGPVVASAGWQSAVPFDVSGATVYRSGKLSTFSAIQNQDVVYYSKSMRTVWAYTNKVTGAINALSPSASAPTSVTVAGKTYAIATPDAAYDLSDLGTYQVGDSVTLLLGRNDGVAAVVKRAESAGVLYGIVLSISSASYSDGKGGTYTARTATVCATDGSQYSYQVEDKTLDAGDLVRVVNENGGVQVKRLSSASLTGKVSAGGAKLGSYVLADDVEILDTYKEGTPVRVYPSRLSGVSMSGDMVRYYALNTKGEISHLILNDVTGDMHQYGVITDVTEVNASLPTGGFLISSQYEFDVGGQSMMFGSESAVYNLKEGPCQVKMDTASSIDRLYNLTEVKLESVTGSVALGKDNRSYTLSDAVAVYELVNGEYQYSSLARVNDGTHTLTGWYDKAESAGGRIRVIVAK